MFHKLRGKTALFGLLMFLLLLTACADANTVADTAGTSGSIAGFWPGLWHGMIMPIAFIVSLFSDRTAIYEVHNNGGWYNFGFVLGAGVLFGGSSSGASSSKRS